MGNSEHIMRGRDKKAFHNTDHVMGTENKEVDQRNRKSAGVLETTVGLVKHSWLSAAWAYVMSHSADMALATHSQNSLSFRYTQVIQLKLVIIQTHLIGLVSKHIQQAVGLLLVAKV